MTVLTKCIPSLNHVSDLIQQQCPLPQQSPTQHITGSSDGSSVGAGAGAGASWEI